MSAEPEPGFSEGGSHSAASDRRARLLWSRLAGVVALVVLLLLLSSGGFFLYAAVVTLGLLLISTGVATASILGLELRRGLSATEVELGEAVDSQLVLTNKKQWPAWFLFLEERIDDGLDLEGASCRLVSLEGGKSDRLRYCLHTTRRGFFRIGPAVVEAGEPFGLVRRFLVDAAPQFLTVLPRRLEMSRGLPLGHRPVHENPRRRSLLEDPSRFHGVREYRPGDPLRRIHWRAAARTGTLQIKLFEPAVLEGILLAVDMEEGVYGPAPGRAEEENPLEELAITAAASLAELVLAGSQRVGLLSNGADAAERYAHEWKGGTFRSLEEMDNSPGRPRPPVSEVPVEVPAARGDRQRERIFHALARLVPARASLAELLHRELPRISRQMVVVIVTPRIDTALVVVVAELERSGFEVAVVWIDPPGNLWEPVAKSSPLPSAAPVYRIAAEDDLLRLGSQRL